MRREAAPPATTLTSQMFIKQLLNLDLVCWAYGPRPSLEDAVEKNELAFSLSLCYQTPGVTHVRQACYN